VLPDGRAVPAALLSGHHGEIARWKRERSLEWTARRRPDLIEQARLAGRLTSQDEQVLMRIEQRTSGQLSL
jgi:tRNA (guanine37-N1)-methyltransferase